MPNSSTLPHFRYHPDPVETGSITASDAACTRCGERRGFIYAGPVYAVGDFRDALCPWCIADGSAHESLGATFVDSAPAAIRAVKANLEALGAEAEVVRADALRWLRSAPSGGRQYDLVFLDPPYRRAGELGAPLSAALLPVLAGGALVVAEADRRAPLELTITATDERRYGDTLIRLHAP